jgi:hypothetical protein
MFQSRRLSVSFIAFALVALTLALIFSCSDQPTTINAEAVDDLNGSGTMDPGASGRFLIGEVSDTSLGTGTLEVWAMNAAFDDSTGMATFDVQILNGTQSRFHLPVRFLITSIRPDDIAVVDFDGIDSGFPFYNISERLGGGDILEPGERTEPVTMKFHVRLPRSFAISFRFAAAPAPLTGAIEGVVFNDSNENGERDRSCRCEPGIPGITVAIEKMLENGDMVTLIARTDSNGEYRFEGLEAGVHKVFVVAPGSVWKVTSANPLLVTLIEGYFGKVQDFLGANFGLFRLHPPAEEDLFGPIVIGPFSSFGTELDSTFVNPPSPLTVVFNYYVNVDVPVTAMVMPPGMIDSAEAWINGELIFRYARTMPPDTAYFGPQTVRIPDGLVQEGENTIRLLTAGNEHAALMWRVYRKP